MPDRFLRRKEIKKITGLSDATLWRHERDGKFPKRRHIGPRSVAWLESEISEWMKSCQQKSFSS